MLTYDWLKQVEVVLGFAYFLTCQKYANEPETTLKHFGNVSALFQCFISVLFQMCGRLK
jgi:hypothetical protein